jgi:hypothetical protein
MPNIKQDSSTFSLKKSLRIKALGEIAAPVVMETHGGYGKLFGPCYSHLEQGVVFEKRPERSAKLAMQRPGWAVYEADCEAALRAGVGGHLPVNFVDFDPYGSPWLAMAAFFEGIRPEVPRLALVVTDGLPQRLKLSMAWNTEGLEAAVQHFGNAAMYGRYLDACQWMVQDKASRAGYALRRWTAYLCGFNHHVAHYAAVLDRIS